MKHPVSDLKRTAGETLFKGWSVTPAMKERLQEHIGRLEAGAQPPADQRKRLRPRVWTLVGLAAACAVTVVGLRLQTAPMPPAAPPPTLNEGLNKVPIRAARPYDAATTNLTVQAAVRDNNGNSVVVQSGSPIPIREAQPGQRLIYQAEYTLQVENARDAMDRLQELTIGLGGYVADAVLDQAEAGAHSGRIVLRVPAPSYEQAIGSLKGFGAIKRERQWAQDVTSEYTDMENRLRTLEEFEGQLRGLAASAANFDDWLRLSRQINETRVEIDNLKGHLKRLTNQVEYATLTVSLVEPGAAEQMAGAGLGARSVQAFERSVQALGALAAAAVVGIAAAAPFLLPALVAGAALLLLMRRRSQR